MSADWRDFEIDEIPEWSTKAQVFLLAVFSSILLFATIFLVILPLNAQMLMAKQEENELKNQFRLKAQQVAALPDVDDQVEKLQLFYHKLTEQLPEESELALLLAGINDTGLQYNLDFERLNWQGGLQIGWLYQLSLDIELKGQYRDVASFSAALARLPRIVALQGFTLERTNEAEGLLTFIVTAHTYRYVEALGVKS